MRWANIEESWGKSKKKEGDAPIADWWQRSELGQKREKRGKCSNRGQEEKERVGAKVRKKRKILQLWTGSEEASWGKSDRKEKNTTIMGNMGKLCGAVKRHGIMENKKNEHIKVIL